MPRASSDDFKKLSASSISKQGFCSSIYRKIAEGLILLASSDRGVNQLSRIRTLVLPHRLVGDVNTTNGEISPASNVQACRIQSANASAAYFGRTIYRLKTATIESSSAAGVTASGHGFTCQCGNAPPSSACLRRSLTTR